MSKRPQEQHLPGIGRLVTTNTVDSRAREFLLLKDRVTVGSDEASDFIIRDETISRRHAILTFQAGRLEVKDLGSTNGTFLNGKRIIGISAFDKGDRIRFGTADFVFLRNASPASIGQIRGDSRSLAPAAKRRRSVRKRIGDRTRLASIDGSDPRDFWLAKRKVSIGSAPQNSLVLSHATISQRHAKLRRRFGKYSLIDLGSTNGTFVNGKRLTSRQRLVRGDELRFGSARFVFLQSPTSRDLKWLSPRTSIALLLLIFLAGLAATENYIIRSSSQGKT